MSDSAHPQTHLRQGLRAYAGLLLLALCVYILLYSPQPLLNTLSVDFGTSKAAASFVIGVFMLSMCVSPLFVGLLLDRTGVRRALLASSALFALSCLPILVCDSFLPFLAIRTFQALLMPVALTAVMSSISSIFRHYDMTRAMAGYIAVNLGGSLSARLVCGVAGELFGWRITLAAVGAVFVVALALLAFNLSDPPHHKGRLHPLGEYLRVFRIPCVGSLLYAEGCGLFVFGGVGNLVPFRMAELAPAAGEGRVGLMYAGYATGIAVSFCLGWLQRKAGGPMRLLAAGSLLYALSFVALYFPSDVVLFAGIWVVAFAQFIIHALSPGFINRQTFGHCDRGMVNGLYLSCYYVGGLLGSTIPILLYDHLGWGWAFGCMELVLLSSFLVLFRMYRHHPEFNEHRA